MSTPAAREELQPARQDFVGFFVFFPVIQERGADAGRASGSFSGVASEVMHHARARDGSDEHIIQRASLLTEPIYFDNQFTIVPVAASERKKTKQKAGPVIYWD